MYASRGRDEPARKSGGRLCAKGRIQLVERVRQRDAVAAEGVEDARDAVVPVGRELDQDHPAVLGRTGPANKPSFLGALDELRHGRLPQVQASADLGDGGMAVGRSLHLEEE